MSQQFYDFFALANMSLQERLGRSGATLNRNSAVLGWQTRSFVQMLNYGRDAITARAASHLLNMDILNSNDAYLLKLAEGLLLNSIESVTPPRLFKSNPFRFRSAQSYERWSSVGNIGLKDGSKVSLVVYDPHTEDESRPGYYSVAYCAGNYVKQEIREGFDGYTLGVFSPIAVPETYKSVWTDSVEIVLELSGTDERKSLVPVWSMDALLAMPDASDAVLCFHTPRGMVLVLGDGEVFGGGYNGKDLPAITGMVVTYVKCDSLAPVDNATISFNSDITPTGEVPVLTPLSVGDTSDTLRSRAVAEFFAAGKITNAQDLATELRKIPWIKSVYARPEYNWPMGYTLNAIVEGRDSDNPDKRAMYERHAYSPDRTYTPGALVAYEGVFYICTALHPEGTPDDLNGWIRFMGFADAVTLFQSGSTYFPSANVYDNATIVVSGLVCASRMYWTENGKYSVGSVVYHSGTGELWLALREDGGQVEPGSESNVSIYENDGRGRCWVNREDAQELVTAGVLALTMMEGFSEYVPMTQAMYEAEFKGYFNIAGKLGFTSVVVEPLLQYSVTVDVKYTTRSPVSAEVQGVIQDYICYEVGKDLRADSLNSLLTTKFNLTSVYITIRGPEGSVSAGDDHYQLPAACYVPSGNLTVKIEERI